MVIIIYLNEKVYNDTTTGKKFYEITEIIKLNKRGKLLALFITTTICKQMHVG